MKNYHDYCNLYLGSSDIATLIGVGMSKEGPLTTNTLKFGGDSRYTAHFINEEFEIPAHYRLECEFEYWLKVYDDERCTLYIRAGKGKPIKIYQSGMYGCLIYAPGATVEEV